VENAILHIGARVIWHVGRSIHVLFNQHIRCHRIPTIWMDSSPSWNLERGPNRFVHRCGIRIIIEKCLEQTTYSCSNVGYFSSLAVGIALVSVLSAIGVCERCRVESGGVYFLLSHVLGPRSAAAVGVLYVFGQVCNIVT
jgi:hypothetical protein